jgi:hypothetical protein
LSPPTSKTMEYQNAHKQVPDAPGIAKPLYRNRLASPLDSATSAISGTLMGGLKKEPIFALYRLVRKRGSRLDAATC